MNPPHNLTVFPKICADMGGAESVVTSTRYAYVKLPGQVKSVRLTLSTLPDRSKWTSFTLADACEGLVKGVK